jgi:hypothetical protein
MAANPARTALSRAVNRAIANGAPVIEEKPTLAALKARVDAASDAFDAACRPHYVNRWDYYLALERGEKTPRAVDAAADAYQAATHAFYAARDGAGGFLGSRGL